MSDIVQKVEFHPLAEIDIAEAAEWYDPQSVGLGFSFLTEFDKIRILITAFPLMYPVLTSNIHKAVLNRFPYIVLYNIP